MKNQTLKFLILLLFPFYLDAKIPQNVSELWENYDPRIDPLKTEVIKSWNTDEGNFQLIRYAVGQLKGSNKSAEPMIAAYYGHPKGASKAPAIVQIHGGGQRANLRRVEYWVSMGYAAISINWGGKVLEQPTTPNTDWDGLAAGFIGNKDQTHHNEIAPSKNTLFKEPHPLNSSWMLIAMSARRAITFLEQQPLVNPDRIGVEGHSMGGRSTSYTAIDQRIKAASPSVGGSGYLYEDLWGLPSSSRRMQEYVEHYKNTISSQNYWEHVTCPTLFLGSTNDFNSPTEFVTRGLAQLPKSTDRRLVLAPHLNHRFTHSTQIARVLWMESHLKNNFEFPKTSKAIIDLNTSSRIPVFKVWPDQSTQHRIVKVDVYYGYARDPRIRFWRDAKTKKVGDHYEAKCPIFDTEEPLFAFANITYDTGRVTKLPTNSQGTHLLTLASDYICIYPDALKQHKVHATAKTQRLIDDFSRGWHDWYTLSYDNTQHWFVSTRKILDPSWMAPDQASLAVEVNTDSPNNQMTITLEQNTWQGYTGRKRDTYFTSVELPNAGKNKVLVQLKDFKNEKGEQLKVWNESTELSFSQSAHPKFKSIKKTKWNGKAPTLSNLRWVGGQYSKVLHPHQSRKGPIASNTTDFDSEFQQSIKDSVELEKLDEKQ